MSEIINEKVSVLVYYDRDKVTVMPLKVKWQGRVYRIDKIGMQYPVRQGRKLLHYFAVITTDKTSFKLKYDTETMHWILEEVIDEFAT